MSLNAQTILELQPWSKSKQITENRQYLITEFNRSFLVAEVPFHYSRLGFADYMCKYYGPVYKNNLESYISIIRAICLHIRKL